MYEIRKENTGISKIASRDNSRYAINAIEFEPSGRMVATDGRRLMVQHVYMTGDHQEPLLVPLETFDRGVKLIPTKGRPDHQKAVIGNGEPGKCTVSAGDTIVSGQQSESNFPKWRDVIPDPMRLKAAVAVDADLLAELLKAMPPGEGGKRLVAIGVNEWNTPLTIWTLETPAAPTLAVIMPIDGKIGDNLPAQQRKLKKVISSFKETEPFLKTKAPATVKVDAADCVEKSEPDCAAGEAPAEIEPESPPPASTQSADAGAASEAPEASDGPTCNQCGKRVPAGKRFCGVTCLKAFKASQGNPAIMGKAVPNDE